MSEHTQDQPQVFALTGRLDAVTAPDWEAKLLQLAESSGGVQLDLSGLEYISSAGLRLILMLAKRLQAQGHSLSVSGMNDNVRHVFEMSGFLQIIQSVD